MHAQKANSKKWMRSRVIFSRLAATPKCCCRAARARAPSSAPCELCRAAQRKMAAALLSLQQHATTEVRREVASQPSSKNRPSALCKPFAACTGCRLRARHRGREGLSGRASQGSGCRGAPPAPLAAVGRGAGQARSAPRPASGARQGALLERDHASAARSTLDQGGSIRSDPAPGSQASQAFLPSTPRCLQHRRWRAACLFRPPGNGVAPAVSAWERSGS